MDNVISKIEKVVKRKTLPWHIEGHTVTVELTQDSRKQKVKITKKRDKYVFSSLIYKSSLIKNKKLRRALAYRAWRKNYLKDLVTFAFDSRGNLIGVIEQPVLTVDHEEVELYINTLARECDRFEYLLTGEDYH